MARIEVPVLIVGAGPAGLMSAILLERLGVETLLVERREGPKRAPAAHVVNARTFEICRAAGVDMDAIAKAVLSPEDAGVVEWVTKIGGERLGSLPFERQGDDQLAVTPTPLRNLSQNRFEPILVDLLDALGASPRWSCQWESSSEDADAVTTRCVDRGSDEVLEVRSRYVIAADGAGSRVRAALGIAMQGPDKLDSFIMIHFKGALRSRLGNPPAVLSFVCDPDSIGVFVTHDLDDEAVFMMSFDDTVESVEDYDVQRCTELVRAALEDPEFDFQVENVSTWTMTAQVAERYAAGRTFLVGDSAHRFPPTGGLGLNSGVQDAHNLAWKIAFVLRGDAPESLLASYASERRPVAQNNANQSLKNALRLIEVPQVLGLVERDAGARDRMRDVLESTEGRARLAEAIAHQAEHFDMPGSQLGFRYAAEVQPPDPRSFEPSGLPGARLPHAWLQDAGRRSSLLDQVPLGRFCLVVGPDGDAWIEAAKSIHRDRLLVFRLEHGAVIDLPGWLEAAGIEAAGALLVRPDQHVAARWETQRGAANLSAALADALGGRNEVPH